MTGSAAAGVKRKRPSEAKFYAVKAGFKPGVYYSWPECFSQVKGFGRAEFKSFTSLKDAEAFVKYGHEARTTTKKTQKFYGVASGRVPGVYDNWSAAQEQITGWPRPCVKAFPTKTEAAEYVKHGGATPIAAPAAKKQKKKAADNFELPDPEDIDFEAGDGLLPLGAEDGFDHRIQMNPSTGKIEYKTDDQLNAKVWQATSAVDNGLVKIYTDGSSLGNGLNGAVAGVGVYFGPRDKRNVSEPLKGTRQTNQRAELTAIQRALELAPRDRPVAIYSDSNYAIKCVTEWFPRWRANEWVSTSKKPVENKDIIEKVVNMLEDREKIGNLYGQAGSVDGSAGGDGEVVKGRAKVQFIWVKGHANDVGNNAADKLAVAAAQRAKK